MLQQIYAKIISYGSKENTATIDPLFTELWQK